MVPEKFLQLFLHEVFKKVLLYFFFQEFSKALPKIATGILLRISPEIPSGFLSEIHAWNPSDITLRKYFLSPDTFGDFRDFFKNSSKDIRKSSKKIFSNPIRIASEVP